MTQGLQANQVNVSILSCSCKTTLCKLLIESNYDLDNIREGNCWLQVLRFQMSSTLLLTLVVQLQYTLRQISRPLSQWWAWVLPSQEPFAFVGSILQYCLFPKKYARCLLFTQVKKNIEFCHLGCQFMQPLFLDLMTTKGLRLTHSTTLWT